MNTKRCLLALSLCLCLCLCFSMRCDAQESKPRALLSDPFAAAEKRREEDAKERAAKREKDVAALREDLAAPWTSVTIALAFDCSCTGPEYGGFRIVRSGGSLTVAPWSKTKGKEQTGAARPLTPQQVEKLLAETASFYLAASRSVAPFEEVGPLPQDPDEQKAWAQRYLAAGGKLTNNDALWMEISVVTPAGLKEYNDMWRDDPADFMKWIRAFEITPRQ